MERMLHRRDFFCILTPKNPETTPLLYNFKMHKADFMHRWFFRCSDAIIQT